MLWHFAQGPMTLLRLAWDSFSFSLCLLPWCWIFFLIHCFHPSLALWVRVPNVSFHSNLTYTNQGSRSPGAVGISLSLLPRCLNQMLSGHTVPSSCDWHVSTPGVPHCPSKSSFLPQVQSLLPKWLPSFQWLSRQIPLKGLLVRTTKSSQPIHKPHEKANQSHVLNSHLALNHSSYSIVFLVLTLMFPKIKLFNFNMNLPSFLRMKKLCHKY